MAIDASMIRKAGTGVRKGIFEEMQNTKYAPFYTFFGELSRASTRLGKL